MLDALKDVQLTDDQVAALDHFFTEHTKNIRSEIESDFQNEMTELKSEIEALKSNPITEGNENLITKEDATKALELFKEDAAKAFELFKEDNVKAFELFKADLNKQYSENMVEALQSLYVELHERVKEDFKMSDEYKAFEKFINIAKPMVLKEKESLFEEIENLRSEKEKLSQEKEELAKKDTITTLLESFPKEHIEEARAFLESASSEDEIYERFQIFGKTLEKVKASSKVVVPEKKPVVESTTTTSAPAKKPIFESATPSVKPVVAKEEKNKKDELTVEDYLHFLNNPVMV